MIEPQSRSTLKGHICLITGSTRGIGRGLAYAVALAGADVAIVGTKLSEANDVACAIQETMGVRTTGIQCDVRDSAQVEKMFDSCEKKLGIPDLLLNNAGITLIKESIELTDDEWKNILDVNLNGAFYCCRALAKRLITRNMKGSFVNLVSNSHMVSVVPGEAAYNASKAGLLMLTKTLAVEWIDKGIRVNSISPGFIMTDLISDEDHETLAGWASRIPLGRMGTPAELAGALIYLFHDDSTFTVGCDIVIDGGYTCL